MRFKNLLLVITIISTICNSGCVEKGVGPDTTPGVEPTNYPTNFRVSAVSETTITVSWNDAVGDVIPQNYLVLAIQEPGIPEFPEDSVKPVADRHTKIIPRGAQSIKFVNLYEDSKYRFYIFPFNGSGNNVNFKNSGNPPTTTGRTGMDSQANPIIPLKVGNLWNYTYFHKDSSSTAIYVTIDSTIKFISREVLADGSLWYELKEKDYGFTDYYQLRPDGAWNAFSIDQIPNASLQFTFPGKIGDGGVYKIISTNTSVTVPAGTFTCYHYRMGGTSSYTYDYYIAPNVGIVKYESLSYESNRTRMKRTTEELRRYVLQ